MTTWAESIGTWAEDGATWAGDLLVGQHYFLPPTQTVLNRPLARSMKLRPSAYPFVTFLRGVTVEVGEREYTGGYWHPVSEAEKAELEAAGYGARVVTLMPGQKLPAGLD